MTEEKDINDKINDKLEQFGRTISRIESEYGTTNRRMDRASDEMFRIEKEIRSVIFGNGKPGLMLEIDRLKEINKIVRIQNEELKTQVKALNEYIAEQKGSIRVALWFIGTGVAILIGIAIKLATM